MNEPAKYRKKPVVIEAMGPLINDNAAAIMRWSGAEAVSVEEDRWKGAPQNAMLAITTLEGVMFAEYGDWVIKGVKGEFYPCKPDIFDATYETPR